MCVCVSYKKTSETLSTAGQKTSAAFSTLGTAITRRFGDMRYRILHISLIFCCNILCVLVSFEHHMTLHMSLAQPRLFAFAHCKRFIINSFEQTNPIHPSTTDYIHSCTDVFSFVLSDSGV